jgi:two-component system chemotaxis response regulator CheB
VIAIGASTGGPAAVVEALRPLPRDFNIPILLVQHIGAPFAATYTEWLSTQIRRPAGYPEHGEPVATAAGRVVVAPPDRHLTVRDNRLWLTADPERHSCRPSVDTLFESVAENYADNATGCLLSGMGRDGAAGLLAMRRAGAFTVAQEESTCVVYGMPREAIRLGAANQVLSPDGISRLLARLVAAPQMPQPRPR